MEDPKSFLDEEREREAAVTPEGDNDAKGEGGTEGADTASDTERRTAKEGSAFFDFTAAPEVRAELLGGEEPPRKRELGTVALVLSLVGLLCCGMPVSIAALVVSIVERRRAGRWEGMNLAALVMAIIGIAYTVFSLIMVVVMLIGMGGLMEGLDPAETTGPLGAILSLLFRF